MYLGFNSRVVDLTGWKSGQFRRWNSDFFELQPLSPSITPRLSGLDWY